jgi:hypothetical protein
LSPAQVGAAYSFEIKTEGGLPPLSWRVVSGALPPGLRLSSTGKIEGTPSEAKRDPYGFLVEVSDSSNPPQSYTQAFSLVVRSAPLRIVVGAPALKIVPPASAAPSAEQTPTPVVVPAPKPSAPAATQAPSVPSTESYAIPAPRYSLSQALGDASIYYAAVRRPLSRMQENAGTQPDKGTTPPTGTKQGGGGSPNSPSTFVCIYEDTAAGDRFWLYRPTNKSRASCTPRDTKPLKEGSVSEGATRLLSADENSTLVIVIDPEALGQNLPFNQVFISAQLGFGDQQKNLEVEGYSKVGEAKENTAAQRGMAFESARNVQARVAHIAEIAEDLLRSVLAIPPGAESIDLTGHDSLTAAQEPKFIEILRLYRQEITTISDYLTAPENKPIVQLIANDVLHIDADSLAAAATQVKSDLADALDGKSTTDAAHAALLALWDRNLRLYRRFAAIHAQVAQIETEGIGAAYLLPDKFKNADWSLGAQLAAARAAIQKTGIKGEDCLDATRLAAMTVQGRQECSGLRQAAINVTAASLGMSAVEQLKKLFAEGSLSLRANGAKAGNIVTLTVQAMGTNGATVGIPSVWEIEVKRFGLKHDITDSLLFLYRLNVSSNDTMVPVSTPMGMTPTPMQAPLKAINFAPSPGVTLALTYYKRGNTGGDKFLRGLAPGLGVNVSFMNFNDPGFDLSSRTFTNTTGTNVQVGTGVLYSLFDNAIQFTNGWNLNVDRKRAYFGIGFSFVKFTEKVAAVIKK